MGSAVSFVGHSKSDRGLDVGEQLCDLNLGEPKAGRMMGACGGDYSAGRDRRPLGE